jgi:acetoin utilization deacetylase AcuC-like enzyme
LITFLNTAWKEWDLLGQNGRDPACIPFSSLLVDDDSSSSSNNDEKEPRIPPLIPCNFPLPRENNGGSHHPQRSSKNVMGQIGYYCADTCTPIISELVEELTSDASTVSAAVDIAIDHSSSGNNEKEKESAVVYALCTHPGHHASHDSFGGYCYVNNAALAARLLQERLSQLSPTTDKTPRVAILDVDYHCGNGTASIFYNDPTVLVVSIHCHPDFDYPFHTGFGDETGGDDAKGCTLHVPLLPGATWHGEYQTALLDRAGNAIAMFDPDAFVLSLGLDTYIDDPCAIRRAGFKLKGRVGGSGSDDSDSDYDRMGRTVGEIVVGCSNGTIPTIVLQEGGYEMNAVPSAAADVLLGMAGTIGNGR